MYRETGFTIVEVLVVVALIGIIAAFAVPQFGRIIDNNRVVSTANSVVGLMSFARSDAVRRGQRVMIRPADGANWNSGAVAGVDASGDGALSAAEVIRRIEGAEGTLALTGANLDFRANGMTSAAAPVIYSVCSGSGSGRSVTVSLGGRVNVQEINCP